VEPRQKKGLGTRTLPRIRSRPSGFFEPVIELNPAAPMPVTAVEVEVACEGSGHRVVPPAPNICLTPAAPGPLPAPYPITGDTGKLDPGCEDTLIGGKKCMTTRSKVASMTGNEAGAQKDLLTLKTGGCAWALVGAPVVLVEGGMVVITGAPGFGNTD
jgi:hypothetical protein